MKISMRLTFKQAQLSCEDTTSAKFSAEPKNCVGAARTSLRDAARSFLPRSGTAASVTTVGMAIGN